MIRLQIENKQKTFDKDTIQTFVSHIKNIANALEIAPFIDKSLFEKNVIMKVTIFFTSEKYIREVNRTYRQIGKTTDVLSFPMLEIKNGKLANNLNHSDFYPDTEGNKIVELGDIIICLPRAKKQAECFGHSMEREVAFLALHGFLHLLGFDHENKKDEKKMTDIQKEILDTAGLARTSKENDEGSTGISTSLDRNDMNKTLPHVGFAAVIGRPNVGKSTLINYLSGMKLAIVSPKPQTTRTRIRSVINRENSQIIFLDTPGIHRPKSALANFMVETAFRAAEDGDVILLLVDVTKGRPTNVEKEICALAEKGKTPVILVLNKVDMLKKELLLPLLSSYNELFAFTAMIPVSARTGDGVPQLLDEIERLLPEGPLYYPNGELTDQSERILAAELIREQILYFMKDEIPYNTAVEIESFEDIYPENSKDEYDRKMVRIAAAIYCDKKSHKGMIVGKNGQMAKNIGSRARENIENMCGCKVYLEIFVKTREDWQNKDSILKTLGYQKDV